MLVDNFGDKIVHSSRTGDAQAVGNLVQGKSHDNRLTRLGFPINPRRPQALLLLLLALNH